MSFHSVSSWYKQNMLTFTLLKHHDSLINQKETMLALHGTFPTNLTFFPAGCSLVMLTVCFFYNHFHFYPASSMCSIILFYFCCVVLALFFIVLLFMSYIYLCSIVGGAWDLHCRHDTVATLHKTIKPLHLWTSGMYH